MKQHLTEKKGYYVFKNLNDGDAIYLSPAKVIVEKYPMSGSNDMVVDYEMKSTANVKAEYNPTHQRIKFTIVAKEE